MQLFLSYSSAQAGEAEGVFRELSRRHYAVFFDRSQERGLTPSRQWPEQLGAEIDRSRAVCVLFTEEWAKSPWCLAEYRRAIIADVPVVLIAQPGFDPAGIPAEYRLNQVVKYEPSIELTGDALSRAIDQIALAGRTRRPLSWSKLKEIARARNANAFTLVAERAAGRPNIVRQSAVARVDEFLSGNKSIFLLTGETGSGKTSFLIDIASTVASTGECVPFFLPAAYIDRNSDPASLMHALFEESEYVDVEPNLLLRQIDVLASTNNERRLLLLVDGLNESEKALSLVHLLQGMAASHASVRVILSVRPQAWRTIAEASRPAYALYDIGVRGHRGADAVGVSAPVSCFLESFDEPEFAEAFELYAKHFKIATSLLQVKGRTRTLLRNPWLLAVVCETYAGGAIPNELREADLIDAFLERMCQSGRLIRQDILELRILVRKFFVHEEGITNAARVLLAASATASVERLADAGVLSVQRELERWHIRFGHDRFFEHFAAAASADFIEHSGHYDWLVRQTTSLEMRPYLWGVIKQLIVTAKTQAPAYISALNRVDRGVLNPLRRAVVLELVGRGDTEIARAIVRDCWAEIIGHYERGSPPSDAMIHAIAIAGDCSEAATLAEAWALRDKHVADYAETVLLQRAADKDVTCIHDVIAHRLRSDAKRDPLSRMRALHQISSLVFLCWVVTKGDPKAEEQLRTALRHLWQPILQNVLVGGLASAALPWQIGQIIRSVEQSQSATISVADLHASFQHAKRRGRELNDRLVAIVAEDVDPILAKEALLQASVERSLITSYLFAFASFAFLMREPGLAAASLTEAYSKLAQQEAPGPSVAGIMLALESVIGASFDNASPAAITAYQAISTDWHNRPSLVLSGYKTSYCWEQFSFHSYLHDRLMSGETSIDWEQSVTRLAASNPIVADNAIRRLATVNLAYGVCTPSIRRLVVLAQSEEVGRAAVSAQAALLHLSRSEKALVLGLLDEQQAPSMFIERIDAYASSPMGGERITHALFEFWVRTIAQKDQLLIEWLRRLMSSVRTHRDFRAWIARFLVGALRHATRSS